MFFRQRRQGRSLGGFLLPKIAKCQEEEIARLKNAYPRDANHFNSSREWQPYRSPSQGYLWWQALQTSVRREIRFQCDCSKRRFMDALASLQSSDLESEEETMGRNHLSILPNNITLMKKRLGGTHSWQILIHHLWLGTSRSQTGRSSHLWLA